MSKLITVCQGMGEARSVECVDNREADVTMIAPCKVAMSNCTRTTDDDILETIDDDCGCDC